MENKKSIKIVKERLSLKKLLIFFEKLITQKVLIIGDTILDHYIFVLPKGRAIKDPILSVEFKRSEIYAGGVLAVANHIGSFVKKIKLVTLIGNQNPQLQFINDSLFHNIELITFIKENSPTIVKRRYIDDYKNNKLFKIEYMNDKPITPTLTQKIVYLLQHEVEKYDLVIVGDFGHGFINNEIRKILEEKSKFIAVNVQSNSANMGYNYINYYKNPHFIVMNEEEMRLPLMLRFDDINSVINKFHEFFKYPSFLVTIGKKGSIYFNNGKIIKAPVLTNSVVDTVGAGDAVFAISSLFKFSGAEDELIPFIANCAGGIKANIMGNKESVTKDKLFRFINDLLD